MTLHATRACFCSPLVVTVILTELEKIGRCMGSGEERTRTERAEEEEMLRFTQVLPVVINRGAPIQPSFASHS